MPRGNRPSCDDHAKAIRLRTWFVFRIVDLMPETGVVLSLEGRVAVVTGGSRGIGAAIVRMFSQAGARAVFNYQKASKEAEDLSWACGGAQQCIAIQAELSSSEAAKPLIDAAIQNFGKVDIVVGNHGVWPPHD